MYMTMKHYELTKYHPTLLPFNTSKDDSTRTSEDTREIFRSPIKGHKLNFVNEHNNWIIPKISEDFDKKSEDIESQSSADCNDSGEDSCETQNNSMRNYEDIHSYKCNKSSEQSVTRHTDFSIEKILSQDNSLKTRRTQVNTFEADCNEFDWLKCTRYKPPKIHRKFAKLEI